LEETFAAADCNTASGMEKEDLVLTDLCNHLVYRHKTAIDLVSLLGTCGNTGKTVVTPRLVYLNFISAKRDGIGRAMGNTSGTADTAIRNIPFFKGYVLRFGRRTPPAGKRAPF
jgi:hypothetical protein